MAKTLAQIIALVANRYGRYVTGTAGSGSSATTLVDGGLYLPDNALINHFAYMTGGTTGNLGRERVITAYAQSGGRLTIAPAFPSSIAVGDTYEIKPLPNQDFLDAIQAAIMAAGVTWTIEADTASDEANSITFDGSGDYALPTTCVEVLQVWTQGGDGEYKPVQAFEVVGPLGSKRLILHDYALALESGSGRIRYRALPTLLAVDTDTLGLDDMADRFMVAFIVEYALFHLHNTDLNRARTSDDANMHMTAGQMHYQLAEAIRARAGGGAARVVTAQGAQG